jgi:uncharacterized membrane protein YraQ (UPF0718 family)
MVLYGVTALLLIISFVKDRKKTVQALRKAWKALEHILPEFLVVILLVGLLLALLNPQAISAVIGKDSGLWGLLISLIVGSITLIPGFVAFPTAAMLLQGGAGYMQIGAFISSLMMVGVVTIPVERKYFGLRLTVGRNLLAFLFSVIVALVIGMVMGEL